MSSHAEPSRVSDSVRRLRSRAAPLTKSGLMKVGAYAALRSLLPSRRVAILRYHAICGEEGYAYADPAICISPQAFERHVAYLAANYNVLALPEVVDRLTLGKPLPANCVAITFDDGYADNLEAARTLHRHGLSATFYITAGCLAGDAPFWPAEIRGLLRLVRSSPLHLSTPDQALELPVLTDEDRLRAVRTLTRLFKSNPIPVRERLREQLRGAASEPWTPTCMLQWDQVVEMHRLGMTIGAHTLTHPNLPSAGIDAARHEIAGAKKRLESAVGQPVTQFSYPNGGAERYYTPELQRVVAECGYTAAASSRNAFAGANSDLYALERLEVEERLEDLVFALEVERFAFAPSS